MRSGALSRAARSSGTPTLCPEVRAPTASAALTKRKQGRRREVASEEQGREAGAGDQDWRRAHQLRDGQDRVTGGCDGVGRSGGTARLLLPSAGPEGAGL